MKYCILNISTIHSGSFVDTIDYFLFMKMNNINVVFLTNIDIKKIKDFIIKRYQIKYNNALFFNSIINIKKSDQLYDYDAIIIWGNSYLKCNENIKRILKTKKVNVIQTELTYKNNYIFPSNFNVLNECTNKVYEKNYTKKIYFESLNVLNVKKEKKLLRFNNYYDKCLLNNVIDTSNNNKKATYRFEKFVKMMNEQYTDRITYIFTDWQYDLVKDIILEKDEILFEEVPDMINNLNMLFFHYKMYMGDHSPRMFLECKYLDIPVIFLNENEILPGVDGTFSRLKDYHNNSLEKYKLTLDDAILK